MSGIPCFNAQVDVKVIIEGDGLDISNMDQIMHDLIYMWESLYNDEEIIKCLNITKAQLKEFDALLQQSKRVPMVYF